MCDAGRSQTQKIHLRPDKVKLEMPKKDMEQLTTNYSPTFLSRTEPSRVI